MKNYLYALTLAFSAVALNGCCTEQVFFQAAAVSMTHANFESPLKEGKPVTAQYCQGDAPVSGTSTEIGLMDEAILKAQKESGNAPAILNARFYTSCSCVIVKGNAALADAIHPSRDEGESPKKAKPNKAGKKKG